MSEKNNRGKHRLERAREIARSRMMLSKARWEFVQMLKYLAIASSFFALGILIGSVIR